MKLLISFFAMTALIRSSLWAMVRPTPPYRLSKTLAKVALLLGLAILIMGWYARPALAAIEYLKEADQWIYQAQEMLLDTADTPWEVTVVKPMDEGNKGVSLQLVTQSPTVQLDAAAPLILTTNLGKQLTAPNITPQQFIGSLPDVNVAQYDIQPLLPQLKEMHFSSAASEPTLQLELATKKNGAITLMIPSEVIEEWTTVGSCDYIMCDQ
ncbi:MAG: DUF3122 domain-containing protein [Cyanobacteria bacterium J06555_13]